MLFAFLQGLAMWRMKDIIQEEHVKYVEWKEEHDRTWDAKWEEQCREKAAKGDPFLKMHYRLKDDTARMEANKEKVAAGIPLDWKDLGISKEQYDADMKLDKLHAKKQKAAAKRKAARAKKKAAPKTEPFINEGASI